MSKICNYFTKLSDITWVNLCLMTENHPSIRINRNHRDLYCPKSEADKIESAQYAKMKFMKEMDAKCKEFNEKEQKAAEVAKKLVLSYSRPVSVSLNSSKANWKDRFQTQRSQQFRVISTTNPSLKQLPVQPSRETLGSSSKDKHKSSHTPSDSAVHRLGGSSQNSIENHNGPKLAFPMSIPEVLSQDPEDSQEAEEIDDVLQNLKKSLEQVYSLPKLLKDLTTHATIYKDPLLDSLTNQTSLQKVQELKREADQLYRRFFKSKKYLRLLAIKVGEYIEEQRLLQPVDPKKARDNLSQSDHQHTGSNGNLSTSKIDIHNAGMPLAQSAIGKTFMTGVGLQQQSRPNMLSMESLSQSKAMEKAAGVTSKSKMNKINLKDLLQQEKKMEEFQKRKQIVNSTSRNIITQPLREVLKKQILPLEIATEKQPNRAICAFNKTGRCNSDLR